MGAESGSAGGGQSAGERSLSRSFQESSRAPGSVNAPGSQGQSPGEEALSESFGNVTDQPTGGAGRNFDGVTINVNPRLVEPVSTVREQPVEEQQDTTGLGGGQPSGRRRGRAGTLLIPGLAETARKVLLGQ